MFNLHVLNTNCIINHLSYGFCDLLKGFQKYSEEAKKRGIEIFYHENTLVDQIKEKIDGVFIIWDNGLPMECKYDFKIATFVDDIHWWDKERFDIIVNFFEHVDLVFNPYFRVLMQYKEYQQFHSKFVSLFWWAYDYCFELNTSWNDRQSKILFSGAKGKWYEFRELIVNSTHPLLEKLSHSMRGPFMHPYHGLKYLDYLATFKGATGTSANPIATDYDSSIIHSLDYTLKKNFEILSCGALGFLEETNDFKELGLVPYTHYIPITKNDFYQQFDLLFSKEAQTISECGRKFLLENHSTKNRIISALDMIKDKWL